MANLLAKRYICPDCKSEYLVIREGGGTLACCGKPMILKGDTILGREDQPKYVQGVTPLMGRKYRCPECGTEVVCARAGCELPECCGKKMAYIEPKPVRVTI